MPRVTIGLPVYNGEPFITGAIESILDQTYDDFKLIITDNQSTDGTGAICEAFAKQDSRITFIVNDTNIGGWRNHNKVLKLANTELFMWAGHDDLRSRECLAVCVGLLDQNPDAIMSFVGVKQIDGDGNDMDFNYYVPDFSQASPSDRFASAIRMNFTLEIFYGLTRTPMMKATGGCGQYPDSDRVLAAKLALAGPFAITDDVHFYRRQHAERSIVKYATRQARNEWINPSKHFSGALLPYHRELWEFTRAVLGASVSTAEKRACLKHLRDWRVRHRDRLQDDWRDLLYMASRRIRHRK